MIGPVDVYNISVYADVTVRREIEKDGSRLRLLMQGWQPRTGLGFGKKKTAWFPVAEGAEAAAGMLPQAIERDVLRQGRQVIKNFDAHHCTCLPCPKPAIDVDIDVRPALDFLRRAELIPPSSVTHPSFCLPLDRNTNARALSILATSAAVALGTHFSDPTFSILAPTLGTILGATSKAELAVMYPGLVRTALQAAKNLGGFLPSGRDVIIRFELNSKVTRSSFAASSVQRLFELVIYVRDAHTKVDIHALPIAWEVEGSSEGAPSDGEGMHIVPRQQWGEHSFKHLSLGRFIARGANDKGIRYAHQEQA